MFSDKPSSDADFDSLDQRVISFLKQSVVKSCKRAKPMPGLIRPIPALIPAATWLCKGPRPVPALLPAPTVDQTPVTPASDAMAPPVARPAVRAPTDTLYVVQFKTRSCVFQTLATDTREYFIGDFLIVKCRNGGYDLGMVTATRKRDKTRRVGLILRIASFEEITRLVQQKYDESVVHDFCNRWKDGKWYLQSVRFVSVEYQFDRSKITISYSAAQAMDFSAVLAFTKCRVEMVRETYVTNRRYKPVSV